MKTTKHTARFSTTFFCSLLTTLAVVCAGARPAGAAWLFTSFRGSGDGLHLAYSEDARNWG